MTHWLWAHREEGLKGLWKGIGPNVARNAIVNAAELASYDQAGFFPCPPLVTQSIDRRTYMSGVAFLWSCIAKGYHGSCSRHSCVACKSASTASILLSHLASSSHLTHHKMCMSVKSASPDQAPTEINKACLIKPGVLTRSCTHADQANVDRNRYVFRHSPLPSGLWSRSRILCCLHWVASGCGQV